MRAQAHLINLARPLVGKIRLNHVVREDIALEEELMVSLKRVQCLLERAGLFVKAVCTPRLLDDAPPLVCSIGTSWPDLDVLS